MVLVRGHHWSAEKLLRESMSLKTAAGLGRQKFDVNSRSRMAEIMGYDNNDKIRFSKRSDDLVSGNKGNLRNAVVESPQKEEPMVMLWVSPGNYRHMREIGADALAVSPRSACSNLCHDDNSTRGWHIFLIEQRPTWS